MYYVRSTVGRSSIRGVIAEDESEVGTTTGGDPACVSSFVIFERRLLRWINLRPVLYVPWGATRQVENPLRWLCQSPPGPLPAYASPIEPVVSLLYYL